MYTHIHVPVLPLFSCPKRREEKGPGFSRLHIHLIPVHQWQGDNYPPYTLAQPFIGLIPRPHPAHVGSGHKTSLSSFNTLTPENSLHQERTNRVGGCLAVVAQWQSTGGSSQRYPWFDSRTAGLFTFLYFRLLTSNSSVRQDALSMSGKHWLIESWYKSAVPRVSGCMGFVPFMYNCFVSPVARQWRQQVVAKCDVWKCVLLASQFKSSELLWLNL